jgi:hypothetical protein
MAAAAMVITTTEITTQMANHRHLRNIDCLMACVFFISTVNGRSKKEEKKPIMSCASSGHINKTLAIYLGLSISMWQTQHQKQQQKQQITKCAENC